MFATSLFAIVVVVLALICIAEPDSGHPFTPWQLDTVDFLFSRMILICFGFAVAALVNSFPN
jgi:magnesium-transporting ATPase (P-type)